MVATSVPGGRLSDIAAPQYLAALSDGMPDGCLTDGGRTPEDQAALFESRYEPSRSFLDKGPFKDRRGPYKGRMWKRVRGASVAVPGTSRHESGNAIDLDEPARSWLRARPEYGFVKDIVPGEPWHFEFVASTVTKSAGRAEKPADTTAESDDDMKAIGFIYDGKRAGQNDQKHPDYGSTGVLFPWGFVRTSTGLGSRDDYAGAKAMADASGLVWEERHGDINLLALHLKNGA